MGVGISGDEPEQFVENALGVNFLGRKKRESASLVGRSRRVEVESELASEHTSGSGAGSVALVDAVLENVLQQFEVGLHWIR
jgi:hypothetical protein